MGTKNVSSKTNGLHTRVQRVTTACVLKILSLLLLLLLSAAAQAAFYGGYYYDDNGDGTCTITDYFGPGGDVTIPGTLAGLTVTTIGSYAFEYCNSLTSITIPDSVTTIGSQVFFECSNLTSITIGSSVAIIGVNTFSLCTSLTAITVDALNSTYSSIEGVLFNKSQTELTRYPEGKAGTYTIPDSVTTLGFHAFYNCDGLPGVTIGNSVTTIGDRAFSHCSILTDVIIGNGVTTIGEGAFYYCPNLTGVYFRGDAPGFGASVFDYDDNVTIYYIPETTGWEATYGGHPTAIWPLSPADTDLNYEVDIYDFSVLAGHWLQTGCGDPNWCEWADFDQSGTVDPNDVVLLADDWLFGIVP